MIVFCKLSLQAETVIPNLKQEQQTKAHWSVEPYSPFNVARVNQLYITADTNTVKTGQIVNFRLHLSTFSQKERSYLQHVSYIVSHTCCQLGCNLYIYIFFKKSRFHSLAHYSLHELGVE